MLIEACLQGESGTRTSKKFRRQEKGRTIKMETNSEEKTLMTSELFDKSLKVTIFKNSKYFAETKSVEEPLKFGFRHLFGHEVEHLGFGPNQWMPLDSDTNKLLNILLR